MIDSEVLKCFVMGGTPSRPKKGSRGCWTFRPHIEDEDSFTKKPAKRPVNLEIPSWDSATKADSSCHWEDIPTPSVSDPRDIEIVPPPTQEKLLQMIKCFPFPSPRESPSTSPQLKCHHASNNSERGRPLVDTQNKAFSHAFGKLVQVSVETMAITALPMDVWLKERLKKWVQLSGHEGSIVPASCQTLYKKQEGTCSEARAYEAIMKDKALEGLTPRFYQQLQKNDECFIEIEDLLQQFAEPSKTSIMDIKIGTRTFLESEVSNTKKRADLYQKMIAIDPAEPTEEENACGEITKLRYMQFRERESSSAQLGFRIEAAKMPGGCLQKNFKKVRTYEDVSRTLCTFFGEERERVRTQLLKRLRQMRQSIEQSEFYATHEVVGSSLLIVHDGEKTGCWMIDFAKSHLVGGDRRMDHRSTWLPGNHEDGYLLGIDNLIEILEEMPPVGTFPHEEVVCA